MAASPTRVGYSCPHRRPYQHCAPSKRRVLRVRPPLLRELPAFYQNLPWHLIDVTLACFYLKLTTLIVPEARATPTGASQCRPAGRSTRSSERCDLSALCDDTHGRLAGGGHPAATLSPPPALLTPWGSAHTPKHPELVRALAVKAEKDSHAVLVPSGEPRQVGVRPLLLGPSPTPPAAHTYQSASTAPSASIHS